MLENDRDRLNIFRRFENCFYENAFQIPFLILLGTLIYLPIFDNWFADLAGDDNWMLYENPYVFSLSLDNIAEIFSVFYRGQYSPVNTLAYALNYQLFGMDAFYFHCFSLVVHLINAILVMMFIRSILVRRCGASLLMDSNKRNCNLVAFMVALLFLVHPMQVEAVGWISASKVLLYSLFLLLSLLTYIRYLAFGQLRYFFLAIVLFAFAFGCKEQAVVLPVLLILIDLHWDRSVTNLTVILEKAPFILLAMLFSVVSLSAQNAGFSEELANDYYPFYQRFVLGAFSISEYIFKLLFPLHLSYRYPFPMHPGEGLPLMFYFYIIVFFAFGYGLLQLWSRKRHFVLFGAGFFFSNLFLSLHFIPMARSVLMADRYVYLGSVGIFCIGTRLLVETFRYANPATKYGALAIFVCYVAVLCVYTFVYVDRWNVA